jgi:hexosaminidase
MNKFLLAVCLIGHCIVNGQNKMPTIIPQPNSITLQSGAGITISNKSKIYYNHISLRSSAMFLQQYLQQHYQLNLPVLPAGDVLLKTNNIIFYLLPTAKQTNTEAYELNCNNNSLWVKSKFAQGAFYGMQTLLQLLPTSGALSIDAMAIQDAPRFAYRGLHLDVSRHFFPVSYIKKYIDYIALHKMNTFHWHLTDDQGWRIEIKKYPKLTSIGGYREGTIIGRYPGTGFDSTKYGGYYTQAEVKEVVAYAKDRFITVIPEIEMPGHSMAVLAAYPELSTTPHIEKKVSTTWGVFDKDNNVLNPSETTFAFLENVLLEIMPLFPAKYVHIGGDECSKVWWKESAFCQQLMKEKGLKDEHELQSYFIQRMEKFINGKGKQIIGWDEILEGGLAPNAIVMSWRGEKGGIEAAKQNHQVIMTPGSHCYFDHKQILKEDSVTIGGYSTTEKVYSYEPIPKELNEEQGKLVLGAQANMWTEYMNNTKKVEYMLFPRLSALSEVLWSKKEQRNYADFKNRLQTQFLRYNLWGVNYFKGKLETEPTPAKAK